MNMIPLQFHNSHHTRIVLSFILQSELDYGNLDNDTRLAVWNQRHGKWAIALSDLGIVTGIVCVVPLSDHVEDGLLWIEVLPSFRRKGFGKALLTWATQHSYHQQYPLFIKSVPSAEAFYHACSY